MKCYDCKNINLDKGFLPCSMCSHRPHELCTSDNFEPKEPKVLTIKEMIVSCSPYMVVDDRLSIAEDQLKDLVEKADKNGQLIEWNRTKELREVIESWIKTANNMSQKPLGYNLLYIAYKNIKPPYQQ